MKLNLLLTATIAVLAFASCKKNDPAPGNPVSKRLKKVTQTENGTVTVYNLSYNAAGKLASYNSSDNSETTVFTYDAAGNLTGIEHKDRTDRNLYAFTYVNNIPATGTFKSWDISGGTPGTLTEEHALTYTLSNNWVSKIKITMAGAPDTEFNLAYANGNLSSVSTNGFFNSVISFTFGTKKPVFPKLTNYVLDQAGFSLLFAANNELTKVAYDFPGTTHDYEINTTYTYDSNGYALTSNDGTVQQVFEYE